DGACRDVDEARDLGFPVYARSATPRTARGRIVEQSFNTPVRFGGVTVEPGDLVLADWTGAVFLPSARAEEGVTLAAQLAAREVAGRALARRMAGLVLKSHYTCTSDRATLVNKLYPGIQAFGAIALNNSVGGLNPLAVDIAGRLGCKVVWFPTVDSANELENVAGQRDESKLPYW